MVRRRNVLLLIAATAYLAVTGCAPKVDLEMMKNAKPERPAELDRLVPFIGEWVSEGVATLHGVDEPLKGTGTMSYTWEANDNIMIERGMYDMGEVGSMHSVSVWQYDTKTKKFRVWWFDDFGSVGKGTCTYCPKSKTWHMKAKSTGCMGDTSSEGTMTFVTDNKLEWTWMEYDSLKLNKFGEWKGTSTKKK